MNVKTNFAVEVSTGNQKVTDKSLPGNLHTRNCRLDDGKKIWELVKKTGGLDLNSAYCYLLLCDHFKDTCLVVESEDKNICAFVSAYFLPNDVNTLFIWQIGIDKAFRKRGLGKKLLLDLLSQPICANITQIIATVSPSNQASLNLFRSLANHLNTSFKSEHYYSSNFFPGAKHEQEDLITVGPLNYSE